MAGRNLMFGNITYQEKTSKGTMNMNTTVTIIIMREGDSDLLKSGKDIYLVSILLTAVQCISTLWLQNNLYFFSMGDCSNRDNAFFQIKQITLQTAG